MPDNEETLLPSLATIQARLSRNQKERARLRTLFRLALEVREERSGRETREPDQASATGRRAVGT